VEQTTGATLSLYTPSPAREVVGLFIITHTCHRRYAHQRLIAHLDSITYLITFPITVPLVLSLGVVDSVFRGCTLLVFLVLFHVFFIH
jgi:hypothetical protein